MDRSLFENRQHGTNQFPFEIYTVDYLNGGALFNLHWHSEFEIVYLEKGEIFFQVGSEQFPMKEGEAFLIQSEQLHAAYPKNHSSFKLQAIVFHINLLKNFSFDTVDVKFLEQLESVYFPKVVKLNLCNDNNVIQKLVTTYFHQDYAFELDMKAYLYHILASVFRQNMQQLQEITPIKERKIDLIKMILEYIEKYYMKDISVKILADQLQMSEGHFTRFFKSIVHMTPIEYINFIRINKACNLLRETDKKMLEIAIDVGFNNHSYFTRVFKKQKGCPPKEYRKKADASH
jgi:AraC-like DNA-binding protein